MILKSPLSHLYSNSARSRFIVIGVVLMSSALIALAFMIQKGWDDTVQLLCGIYTLAITFFFGAQVWGFMASQTDYSSEVEHPKFELLEREEAEWKGHL